MKDKLNKITERCGGNSLAHVLKKLRPLGLEADEAPENMIEINHCCWVNEIWQDVYPFYWQLLKDNQEAKLQDQSEETISAIHKLISGE